MTPTGALIDTSNRVLYWLKPLTLAWTENKPFWDTFWKNRDRVIGFAYTQTGHTICPFPSYDQITMFAAAEAAIEKRLQWWIVDESACSLARWDGRYRLDYFTMRVFDPIWVGALREKSGIGKLISSPEIVIDERNP
jgi:hypothetical protein